MLASVLGINDPWIWMAYVLCLAATAFCVIFALVMRNRGGEDPVRKADRTWVENEKKVEEQL
jgi:hypothetical protein